MSEKILVVDDEEDYLNVMMLHLKKRGYEVLGASDPFQALEIIEKRGFELSILVTDWMMPGMSGNELVRNAKKINPLIEAIVITAVGEMGLTGKMGYGAFGYLVKPLKSMKELSLMVGQAIEKRSERESKESFNY